ncbi:branched-chain amino acid aminotransferase [Ferrovibrio terrae]|uniref:Branched-chain-amino-acid aminotransferase n=1 Tax=Ferrovibrio terrae TaxID=2594003 RepID=A0A516H2Y0_9PROT|nr:branched-chain amino acid aminotransferase [Ferrovibrio terrae]QDO98127.1 branched-chain amino acid aminotransferase [Ferrovibrio terrae]
MSLLPYDDRDGLIWLDGKLVPFRDAKLHVLTHGLHYASAVFEGERAYGGEVFHLTEHSQRLIDSGKLLDFTIPYSVEEIDRATRETVAANKMADCYIRPIAWRGSEMMGVSAQQNKIHVAIAVWEWPSYFSPEAKMKGLRLQISDWRRPAPNTAPTKAKAVGLYMICTLSKHKAEREGYQDALMLDWRGQIAEATGANIFFAKDGKLHTPTPDCFLDGITRRAVIAMAKGRGIEVIERPMQPEEMAGFDECFLTGTAAEVTPVSEIGPYKFTPGKICQALLGEFDLATRAKKAA